MKKYPIVEANQEFASDFAGFFWEELQDTDEAPTKTKAVALGAALARAARKHAVAWTE